MPRGNACETDTPHGTIDITEAIGAWDAIRILPETHPPRHSAAWTTMRTIHRTISKSPRRAVWREGRIPRPVSIAYYFAKI